MTNNDAASKGFRFCFKKPAQNNLNKIKESKLIKIPIVKSFGEPSLAVVSESDKNIYREIEETNRKESDSKRDEW